MMNGQKNIKILFLCSSLPVNSCAQIRIYASNKLNNLQISTSGMVLYVYIAVSNSIPQLHGLSFSRRTHM